MFLMDKYTLKKRKNQDEVKFLRNHVSESTLLRVKSCAGKLDFLANATLDRRKLALGLFCGNRFCSMCAWRLAKKDALKIAILMKYIQLEHKKEFIFVTLTAPNVRGADLPKEITRYNKAFLKLNKRKELLPVVKGYIRKLEVTYNKERHDFHPHFHVLIAVNSSYFVSKSYIKQDKWLNLWRDVMGDDTITQVDVRKVTDKSTESSAVMEISKYASKDSDYCYSQEVFDYFYTALKGRQIITYNGLFAEANKLYKAGELDYLKEFDQTEWVYLLLYRWGFNEYIEEERRELTEDEKRKYNRQLLDEAEDVE